MYVLAVDGSYKRRFISRKNSSFDSKSHGKYLGTVCSHNIIDTLSKSSSNFNTGNRDPTSFILMSAKLSRRVGWNETVRACRDPFDNKKFSNLNPEILVEWIAPTVSYWCSHRNSGTVPVPVKGFDSVVKHQMVLGFLEYPVSKRTLMCRCLCASDWAPTSRYNQPHSLFSFMSFLF